MSYGNVITCQNRSFCRYLLHMKMDQNGGRAYKASVTKTVSYKRSFVNYKIICAGFCRYVTSMAAHETTK